MKRTVTLIVTLTVLNFAWAEGNPKLDLLVSALGKIESPVSQSSILKGMLDSLKGQRGMAEPVGWSDVYARLKSSQDETVRSNAKALSAIFGGKDALGELRSLMEDPSAPLKARRQALDSLVAQRDPDSLGALLGLIHSNNVLREPALRGLSGYGDPRVPQAIVSAFSTLGTDGKRIAIQSLLARPSGAMAFTAAIDAGIIPKGELNTTIARQMQGLRVAELDGWLAKNFGAVSAPDEDKQKLIAKYREFVTPNLVLRGDVQHGRAIFAQTCIACHTLFGTGGKIGPELPGSYEDLDYLLVNILDPNAVIGKDYQQTFVKTKDGQIVAGMVTEDTARGISMKTLDGSLVTVQRADISSVEVSPLSMMPEGLLTPLNEDAVRDLFLYLRQRAQVPMLLTAVNANDFFNASDLQNWRQEKNGPWQVKSGEIHGEVSGKSPAALTSAMTADDYRLTAQVQVSGKNAAAEMVLSGERDASGFHGVTLGFGGPCALALIDYRAAAQPIITPGTRSLGESGWHEIEVLRKDGRIRVSVDGKVEFETADPRHRRRVSPAFHLHGENARLQIRGLQIKPLS